MEKRRKKFQGFSLGELLVVITIVILLAITIMMGYQTQVAKANDAKRKEDLNKFKIALEDYYNDKNCYPSVEEMNTTWQCGSSDFAPYMDKFLCDPITRTHYYYLPIADSAGTLLSPCVGYRLFVKLQNKGDPDINSVGCSWTMGCGKELLLPSYNYGIAVGGSLTAADFVPNPTSSPTPSPTPAIMGSNFCLGDGSKKCNLKTGCAPDYGKQGCNVVLINTFGCTGFVNASECNKLCQSDYAKYKCPATETLYCAAWNRSQCK